MTVAVKARSQAEAEMIKSDGRFVWHELAAADTEAAKAFYTGVVGWGATEAPMAGSVYTVFTAAGVPVAGLARLQAGARRSGVSPQWMGYVAVGDVDAVARRVKKLGGAVRVPPTDVPNASRFSVIADPQRATLGLIKGPAEAGVELPAQPWARGHAVWRELIACDWEKAFLFYHKLLGWKKGAATQSLGGNYQEFSAGAETIGAMINGPDIAGFAVWVYYFGVGNIEAAAKQVAARGGKILYGPMTVPGAARIVQCQDPQGAVFGLMDMRVHIAIGCYAPRETLERR
jgi:predicted enzyme related to lactoylglutathione lyase